MTDNIQELETTLNNIVIESVQPIKRNVGRPRKIVDENAPKKKEYYIKKNTKPTGRPITKSPEELKKNARRLEKEYHKRRGNLIIKVNYFIEKYETIPEELKILPQTTQEELQNKYLKLYDFVSEIKKNKIIKRTTKSSATTILNTI
jgi:hypothetical protein